MTYYGIPNYAQYGYYYNPNFYGALNYQQPQVKRETPVVETPQKKSTGKKLALLAGGLAVGAAVYFYTKGKGDSLTKIIKNGAEETWKDVVNLWNKFLKKSQHSKPIRPINEYNGPRALEAEYAQILKQLNENKDSISPIFSLLPQFAKSLTH